MKNNLQKSIATFFRILFPMILFCSSCTQSYAAPETVTEQVGTNTQTTTPDPSGAADTSVADTSMATGEDQPLAKDPLEKFNRAMFTFNDKLDIYILKPVATFYNAIMPRPLNQGIHNVFLNIGNLPTIANDILQFNFYQMANDMWRLGINTTVGIGGLFDIAGRIGLEPYSNDFGLTLAAWGYDNSTYLVLPFFGPNTIRDGIGIPVDYYAFSIYPYIKPYKTRYAIYGLGIIDRRAQLLQFQSVMEEASLDKYIFVRNAYMQRRAFQIEQNEHRSFADKGWTSGSTDTDTVTTTPEDTNQPVKAQVSDDQEEPIKTDEKQ